MPIDLDSGLLRFFAERGVASFVLNYRVDPESPDPIERQSSKPDLLILSQPVISLERFVHAGSKRRLLGNAPFPEGPRGRGLSRAETLREAVAAPVPVLARATRFPPARAELSRRGHAALATGVTIATGIGRRSAARGQPRV